MPEVAPAELKHAVESQHGGTATFVQAVPVHETHDGETVWDGVVHVFDLAGHPTAKRAYAWSYERDDGKRRFFAFARRSLAFMRLSSTIRSRNASVAEMFACCLFCRGTIAISSLFHGRVSGLVLLDYPSARAVRSHGHVSSQPLFRGRCASILLRRKCGNGVEILSCVPISLSLSRHNAGVFAGELFVGFLASPINRFAYNFSTLRSTSS